MLSKRQQEKRLPNRMYALHKLGKVVDSCETHMQTFAARRMISLYRKQYQIKWDDDRDRTIDVQLDVFSERLHRVSERWFESLKLNNNDKN